MNQRTRDVKLYFIIDLVCLLKWSLSPSVRSFTHSKRPSSPIAPFLLQPLFIHFATLLCMHSFLPTPTPTYILYSGKQIMGRHFCVKSFCRCCYHKSQVRMVSPIEHKINIRRFMLLTVWSLTQYDKIEKLALSTKKRMWDLSSPTMKMTTNAQTAYTVPNTCEKMAQLNGLNPNTYFVYLC